MVMNDASQLTVEYPPDGEAAARLDLGVKLTLSVGKDAFVATPIQRYVMTDVRKDDALPHKPWTYSGQDFASSLIDQTLIGLVGTGVADSNNRTISGNAGFMNRQVLFQAYGQTRVAAVSKYLGLVGNATVDGDGVPWTDSDVGPKEYAANDSWRDMLDELGGDGDVEWYTCAVTPYSFTVDPYFATKTVEDDLRIYAPGNMGRDRTSVKSGVKPVIIEAGRHCTQAPLNRSVAELRNSVRVFTNLTNAFDVVEDAASIAAIGRREIGVYLPDSNPTQRIRYGTVLLNSFKKERKERTVQLALETPGCPVPGVDIALGDWVYLDVGMVTLDRLRVMQYGLGLDGDGLVSASLVLGDRIDDRQAGLARRLTRIQSRVKRLEGDY